MTYSEAKKLLNSKKLAKLGRGYVDTFGPKHVDSSGKKLRQGEYPVGLAREVGFGWGTQTMAFCVPALRDIVEQINRALDPNDGTPAELDLARALKLVKDVPDSTMAAKLSKYIQLSLKEIDRGVETRLVNKRLFTIKNYIDKQIALCD
jgi:hypothetical protein